MKKVLALLSAFTLCSCISAVSVPVSAEENIVYGTMDIPYADFYHAEFQDSANAYEVDAVSSATTSKWAMNAEGKLFEGTYNQANPDGTGSILGVTYPVAVSQADLELLGSDNYNFVKTDSKPQVYKNVSVNNGKAEFSCVQDSTPVRFEGNVKLSTSTAWGDYLLEVENKPEDMGAIYGAIVKTSSGSRYAMRHEENIWRGELAWSTGITTTEPHGNVLDFEDYRSIMGETIDEVTFITLNGYYTAAADTYVPVKFAGSEISAGKGNAGTSGIPLHISGFPDDYARSYTIGDNFSVTDDMISYTDALPGTYTLKISDANGKYADMSASFTLTTDAVPAVYKDGKIIPAENVSEKEFANYIKNISKVTVNGTEHSAAGRGAVKIISDDGTIDFKAESRNGNVFDGTGNYEITVTSTGYDSPLTFRTVSDNGTAAETTKSSAVTTSASSADKPKSTVSTVSSSPSTGDHGIVPVIISAAVLGALAVYTSRKRS